MTTNKNFPWEDFINDRIVARCENKRAAKDFVVEAKRRGVTFYDHKDPRDYIDYIYPECNGDDKPIYLYCGCFRRYQIEYNTMPKEDAKGRVTIAWYQCAKRVKVKQVKQVVYVCPCVNEITILSDKNYGEICVEINSSLALERIVLEFN